MTKPIKSLDPTRLYTRAQLERYLVEHGPRPVREWLRQAYGETQTPVEGHALIPGHPGYFPHLKDRKDRSKPYRSALTDAPLLDYIMMATEHGRRKGLEMPAEPEADKPKKSSKPPGTKEAPKGEAPQEQLALPEGTATAAPPKVERPEPPPSAGGKRDVTPKKEQTTSAPTGSGASVGKTAAISDDPRIDVLVSTTGELLTELRDMKAAQDQMRQDFDEFKQVAVTLEDIKTEIANLMNPIKDRMEIGELLQVDFAKEIAELLDPTGPAAIDAIVAEIRGQEGQASGKA